MTSWESKRKYRGKTSGNLTVGEGPTTCKLKNWKVTERKKVKPLGGGECSKGGGKKKMC